MPANLIPGKSSLSGLQIDAFLLCALHMAHPLCIQAGKGRKKGKRERVHKDSGVSLFIRTVVLLDQGSTRMASFNLNHVPIKVLSPNTITLGVRASPYEF